MDDFNTLNKKELEKKFAEDFSSPIFPILGELYLKNKETIMYTEVIHQLIFQKSQMKN